MGDEPAGDSPPDDGRLVASARIRFTHPGVRTVRLKFTRAARRRLSGRTRVQVSVQAEQGDTGTERTSSRSAILHR